MLFDFSAHVTRSTDFLFYSLTLLLNIVAAC
jgi:hypothetical protein